MPIYEYVCTTCGAHFECRQGFNDSPVQICPQGHHTVRRVFSPPAIVFKGSGFYTTDYARGNGSGAGNPSKEKESSQEK